MIQSSISIGMSPSWRNWLQGILRTYYRLVSPPFCTTCWHGMCSVWSQFSQGCYGNPTMIKSSSFSLCSATGIDLLNCICTWTKLSEFLKSWPWTSLTISAVSSLISAPSDARSSLKLQKKTATELDQPPVAIGWNSRWQLSSCIFILENQKPA